MTARVVMVQGTSSDAGKSALVTGLCRALCRRGVRVAPFKPQNMALNSAVTEDGGEIGRSQAVQARACGLASHSDMNPLLLKPSGDRQAQVIVNGRVAADLDAVDYQSYKRTARAAVLAAFERLVARYDVVVVEGAGSPAEINLRADDIANMGFAEAVDCPVLLVADIDRGGVFASLTGTLALLSASERARVRGFVINRFRGDRSLLDPGLAWLEERTGVPVLGVLPYLHGLFLEAEDALAREPAVGDGLRVVVPALPRISNHTDFDPLRLHPQVDFRFIGPDRVPPPADLVILPGSKHTRADLDWLRGQGWVPYLQRHLRYGGRLLGICGGFQMLGRVIRDPGGADGSAGATAGLHLLDMETVMEPEKRLARATGRLMLEDATVEGYEIHCGHSAGPALGRPLVRLSHGDDGAIGEDGQVAGSYLHGLFDTPAARDALLRWAGLERPAALDFEAQREAGIDRLADAVEAELDWSRVGEVIGDGALRCRSTHPTQEAGPTAP